MLLFSFSVAILLTQTYYIYIHALYTLCIMYTFGTTMKVLNPPNTPRSQTCDLDNIYDYISILSFRII